MMSLLGFFIYTSFILTTNCLITKQANVITSARYVDQNVGLSVNKIRNQFLLQAAADSTKTSLNSSSMSSSKTPDFKAVFSYLTATTIQWSLIFLFLKYPFTFLLNQISIWTLPESTKAVIKTGLVTFFFLFMSLRSRIFSPLDNSRPKPTADEPVFKNRLRPSWQPKPVVFPIVWSTIAILRTISSVLIWKTTGSLISYPLLCIMAHLSIGDTWNTINNVEQRLGTAVLGVQFVYMSVLYTTYQYYLTNPVAAYILAPSCVWLTVANALVFSIWRVNYERFNSPSLFPSVEEGPLSSWRLPFTSLVK